ncbi:hypothetical protein [Xanthomonas arboricola]|uniref:hypothetical protein n=1 Tax=Xanthomonas arboricola TaxID=56448 RepID=UPI0027E164B2|nr:hypothetical protein [Xanthomonas arboricola]
MALFYRPHRRGRMPASFMAGGARGPQGPPVPFGRQTNRALSATPIGLGVADSKTQKESSMSYNTQVAPASAARQMPQRVGLIANTLECTHTAWLSLMARLGSTGKTTRAITIADAAAAITAVDALDAQVRR